MMKQWVENWALWMVVQMALYLASIVVALTAVMLARQLGFLRVPSSAVVRVENLVALMGYCLVLEWEVQWEKR
jgi:hypothetical protein